jgi:hypothetical protein
MQTRSKSIILVKPVALILITVIVCLLNVLLIMTIVMPTNANETDSQNDVTCTVAVTICLNYQLELKKAGESGNENSIKYSVANQVNSTKLMNWIDTLSSFHTRHTKSDYIDNVAYWLKSELQSVCGGKVFFHNFTRIDQETNYNLKNIVCNQEGLEAARSTNNDQLIIISAHYDSRMQDINQTNARAPGADDNASGVAAVLELARILSQINLENKLIQFVLFSGEEQGQWGSKAYVKQLQTNGTLPDLVINLDMIGYRSPGLGTVDIEYDLGNKIRTNDIYSKKVGEFIKGIGPEYTNLETSLSTLGKTDLIPFEAVGSTVIGLHDGGSYKNPNYHMISDVPATLDTEYLTSVTKLALATILEFDFS